MLSSLLLAVAITQAPGVDSVQVYAAILTAVRRAYPELPVVMSETRAAVQCMPLCGANLRDPDAPDIIPRTVPIPEGDHSPELLAKLTDLRLVDVTCPFEEGVFGCSPLPRHLFVALGEIQEKPLRGPHPEAGAVWVRAAFLVPCIHNCPEITADRPFFPDAFGLWFLLRPRGDGSWEIVRNLPAFAV